MEFKKVFRGYDPAEVKKYIKDVSDKEATIRRSQKERIDELLEENLNLRDRIAELQRKQNDISEALIAAQSVSREMEQNAQDYADKALFEAKKFYATWQAYSQTIVAAFTDDELAAFMKLDAKIGEVISDYEARLSANDVGGDTEDGGSAKRKKPSRRTTPDEFVKQIEQAAEELTDKANKMSAASKGETKSPNPITRVEQAAGQSIDLRELVRPDQSLEEICADLGLIE